MQQPSQPNGARPDAARPGRRTRRAHALAFAIAVGGAASPAIAAVAPGGIASDQVPAAILAECERNAKPFNAFDAEVAGAVEDLDALGVFAREDFSAVRIGLCPLRAHQGPVATTACGRDVVLLDEKYAGADERALLRATLAHEMRHVAQHRTRRARLGAAYCESEAYRAERTALEDEADRFGDAAADLFFVGRAIEIANACPVDISIFLEGDGIAAVAAPASLFTAPAWSRVKAPATSTSRHIRYYAESARRDGRRFVWRQARGPDLRFIGGRTVGLRRVALAAPRSVTAPFRLGLACPTAPGDGQ